MTSAGTKQLRAQSGAGLADECVSGPCQAQGAAWKTRHFNMSLLGRKSSLLASAHAALRYKIRSPPFYELVTGCADVNVSHRALDLRPYIP